MILTPLVAHILSKGSGTKGFETRNLRKNSQRTVISDFIIVALTLCKHRCFRATLPDFLLTGILKFHP